MPWFCRECSDEDDRSWSWRLGFISRPRARLRPYDKSYCKIKTKALIVSNPSQRLADLGLAARPRKKLAGVGRQYIHQHVYLHLSDISFTSQYFYIILSMLDLNCILYICVSNWKSVNNCSDAKHKTIRYTLHVNIHTHTQSFLQKMNVLAILQAEICKLCLGVLGYSSAKSVTRQSPTFKKTNQKNVRFLDHKSPGFMLMLT